MLRLEEVLLFGGKVGVVLLTENGLTLLAVLNMLEFAILLKLEFKFWCGDLP